jgi:hypothetical protein
MATIEDFKEKLKSFIPYSLLLNDLWVSFLEIHTLL